MENGMTIKCIMCKADALHTGEVVGSIPTAPTIGNSRKIRAFAHFPTRADFATHCRTLHEHAVGETGNQNDSIR
jgi:hypothetical protein